MTKKDLVLSLYKIGAIKFGQFTLKSGKVSPYYIDLRSLCSYPKLLKQIAKRYGKILSKIKHDLIAGVPYSAIPIATAIALNNNKRMIFTRKELKDHGIKRLIEGVFKPKEKAVIIDDVISNGASKLEVIEPLKREGLIVKDIIVLLDRGQGGPSLMKKKGYVCHYLIDIFDIISVLKRHKKITKTQVEESKSFLAQNKIA